MKKIFILTFVISFSLLFQKSLAATILLLNERDKKCEVQHFDLKLQKMKPISTVDCKCPYSEFGNQRIEVSNDSEKLFFSGCNLAFAVDLKSGKSEVLSPLPSFVKSEDVVDISLINNNLLFSQYILLDDANAEQVQRQGFLLRNNIKIIYDKERLDNSPGALSLYVLYSLDSEKKVWKELGAGLSKSEACEAPGIDYVHNKFFKDFPDKKITSLNTNSNIRSDTCEEGHQPECKTIHRLIQFNKLNFPRTYPPFFTKLNGNAFIFYPFDEGLPGMSSTSPVYFCQSLECENPKTILGWKKGQKERSIILNLLEGYLFISGRNEGGKNETQVLEVSDGDLKLKKTLHRNIIFSL